MADPELGLDERQKELRKWEKPYRYEEFPKMLYRAGPVVAGRVTVAERIVQTEVEERFAREAGWTTNPNGAREMALAEQAERGDEAAARAYWDRRLSPAAQAEAAAHDATSLEHLPEIPAQPLPPKRSRTGRFVKKSG
jgi:hypothetical protein